MQFKWPVASGQWPIGKPQIDHLRGPIWEIRASLENRIARVLFFDDFLKEEGLFEEVTAKALKRAIVEQLHERMQTCKLTKRALAAKMHISRFQLDRLLDPAVERFRMGSLVSAAEALGQRVEIRLINAV